MVWVRNRKFTSTWKNTCATFLHRHPREVRVSQIFQKMCEKHRETTGQQRLTEWDSSSQCCVWHNVMSAAQHCCVLTCVDINTHSRPHSHCSHTHTYTHREAAFNRTEKLFFNCANTPVQHAVSIRTHCQNLSQAFPTAPTVQDCTHTHTHRQPTFFFCLFCKQITTTKCIPQTVALE